MAICSRREFLDRQPHQVGLGVVERALAGDVAVLRLQQDVPVRIGQQGPEGQVPVGERSGGHFDGPPEEPFVLSAQPEPVVEADVDRRGFLDQMGAAHLDVALPALEDVPAGPRPAWWRCWDPLR